ncbi:hypothetical protein [Glycomyces terrestris]|nr:hypothetical protein [Glycomyces terrestris]
MTEVEVETMISAGKYQKVTGQQGRIGDCYFVKVGDSGVIGLAMPHAR